MAKKILTAAQELALIRKKLKHYNTDGNQSRFWLDTGEPELHKVLGGPLGIPYGRIIEISGNESQGKTLLTLNIAAQAQFDKAYVGWMALEDPFDKKWSSQIGLDAEQVAIFESYIGEFEVVRKGKKSIEERLITAEELFEEAEMWMSRTHQKHPDSRIFLGIDSTAAILTDIEASAGVDGQNMRTNAATAMFLSKLLKRWVAIAKNCNAMIIFINQLRTRPGVSFGNPEYTTGGKALKFFCSVRAAMRRKGDRGKMTKSGKLIGIKGVIENLKNKSGEGSIEGEKIGYKLFFNGSSKFVSPREIE